MASAQAMEEELQQSVMLSEDAEYETADTGEEATTPAAARSEARETESMDHRARDSSDMEVDDEDNDDDEELSDRDASGEEIDDGMDQDAEGEENELPNQQMGVNNGHQDDENEDEEGVGAVKIKPGGSDDDDDDGESDISDLPSAVDDDSDEEPAWEEAEEADEDDESDTGPSNTCIFCKQDEENDPSEDFETFLACTRCGDNAHQQCARDAAAMSEQNHAKNWKCPECDGGDSEGENRDGQDGDDASVDNDARPESQLSDGPRGGMSSAQQGPMDTDTQSVSNDLDINEDAAEGSRMLRKRRTSSVEPDGATLSLRRRRRNHSTDAASANEDSDRRLSADASRGSSSRAVRLKAARPSRVMVEKRSRTSLILRIHVRSGNLKEILSRRRRDRGRPGTSARPPRTPVAPAAARPNPPTVAETPILPTPFTTDLCSTPFYSFFDKETEEMKGKPYGGILTEEEADTSKTLPQPDDRRRFDQAKQKAEDEWRLRVLAMQAETEMPVRKSKKSSDNASQIECIEFGGWEIDTWYAAPYPAEYSRNRVLYICEFCLKYMNSDYVAWRHKLKCAAKHPPGDEIYRHGSVSVFEVDGRKNPVYCQNLCLLAKLFLGSKTLYYDVEPFLFYVLCEYDDCGYHFVGYFSKEKRASSQNNVSCILTLPIHQRKGYGNLLIDFSYLLTKVEEKTGSPEKPLSDMGLVSYRNYWRLRLCRYFLEVMEGDRYKRQGLSIKQISDDTGMTPDDVIAALEGLRALVRDQQTKLYAFRIDLEYCRQYVAKWEAKGYVQLKPEGLAWTPYVMGRSNAVNFELGPPINTIAPREDDEARVDEGPNGISAESRAATNGEARDSSQAGAGATSKAGELPELTPFLSIEKVATEEKENAEPQDEAMEDAEAAGSQAWAAPYRGIHPSRFEVFPPIAGGRRGDRSRQSVGRPSGSRNAGSSRPRPKRSGGGGGGSSSSARRPTPGRPRSNTARRKTGGTGRGPGRWPKGTKKSDYGNADSGPGLPPGWREKQARLKAMTDGGDPAEMEEGQEADEEEEEEEEDEEPPKDEVRVFVPKVESTNGIMVGGQAAVEVSSGQQELDGGGGGGGGGGGADEEAQAQDVDAEGEDE